MSKVNVVSAEVSPRLRLQLVANEPISSGEVIVQSDDEEIQSNTLESHVSRLRKNLATHNAGVSIHTIRGVGYLLKADA